MSEIADHLGMAQVAVAALQDLGAVVDRVEIHRGPLAPLVTLALPGRIEQALDTLRQSYRTTGKTSYAELHGCVVAWISPTSTSSPQD